MCSKASILISVLSFLLSINLQGQELLADQKKFSPDAKNYIESPKSTARFHFEFYFAIEEEYDELSVYDTHFLGDEEAKKAHAVNSLYIKKTDIAVGFGTTHTELLKPDILKAVNKLERFFKKALRKESVTQEQAARKMSYFLDIAIVAFYKNDTEEFEEAIRNQKHTEDLIQLFESVVIKQKN